MPFKYWLEKNSCWDLHWVRFWWLGLQTMVVRPLIFLRPEGTVKFCLVFRPNRQCFHLKWAQPSCPSWGPCFKSNQNLVGRSQDRLARGQDWHLQPWPGTAPGASTGSLRMFPSWLKNVLEGLLERSTVRTDDSKQRIKRSLWWSNTWT
jgi:hypothetical protein